eukprot:192298-Rhodomonas_salina.1
MCSTRIDRPCAVPTMYLSVVLAYVSTDHARYQRRIYLWYSRSASYNYPPAMHPLPVYLRCAVPTPPPNQIQETAFSAQIVLGMRFLVFDFALYAARYQHIPYGGGQRRQRASGPQSNTRNRIFSTNCTRNAVSCA